MATTLTKILIHVAFSTQHRAGLIAESVESNLYAYVGGICRRMSSPLLAMNGTADHVHMLVSLGKTTTLADLMMNVKRDSSKWVKQQGVGAFAWQKGYFGFSLGESGVEALEAYFARQKKHHRVRGFQDEMREFMTKYKMEWDERYVWE